MGKFKFICALFLTSCSAIVGVKSFTHTSEKEAQTILNRFEINKTNIATLNENNFTKTVKSISKENTKLFSNLMQPLQIIFFNEDTVKAHLVNCYIGGFPKLKWNEYGNFSVFPLKNEPFRSPVITPALHEYTDCLSISPEFKFVQKYTMIVFWSKALTKSYPDLIKLTKEYADKNNINILYVNSDNLLVAQE